MNIDFVLLFLKDTRSHAQKKFESRVCYFGLFKKKKKNNLPTILPTLNKISKRFK